MNYPDQKKGYVLEVDLDYPESLHDLHNAYPIAVEKVVVKQNELSQFNKDIIKQLEDEKNPISLQGVEKLIHNLNDKKKYVLNIRNL